MTTEPKPGRFDDWVRWLIGGVVAGLVAYAGVGSRLVALETEVRLDGERAKEERVLMRETIERLTVRIADLTDQLRIETSKREALERDRQRVSRDPRLPAFGPQ